MRSNRPIVLGLAATLLLATGVWLALGSGAPTPLPAPAAALGESPAAPASAPPPTEAAPLAPANAPAPERVAGVVGSGVDERNPGLKGRVVDPDGRPLAGVVVSAAPGLGFANGNGRFDPESFDARDMEDMVDGGGFDPAAMLRSVREQLTDRVEVKTDAEGRFRVVAKGSSRGVSLRALGRGFAVLDRRFDRPKDVDVDVGDLQLQAAGIVSGRVLTANGAPVIGARVDRVQEWEGRIMMGMDFDIPELGEVEVLRGGEAVITDDSGNFELAHVAPGDLTLRARHPEHPTAKTQPMTVQAGGELRGVLVTMAVGGVIAGVVAGLPADAKGLQVMAARKPQMPQNDANGMGGMAGMMGGMGFDLDAMLDEAGIGFGERTATIGPDGRFELRGLARETYRVWVARTGGGFAGSTVCSARVEAQPGGNVTLRYDAGVTVTFTVADAKSGTAVERMTVRDRLRGGVGMADIMGLWGGMGGMNNRRASDYPGGAVTVANLRPKANQKLSLTIEALGYAPLERGDIELPKGGNLDLGSLKLDPVPVLTVTVVNAIDGKPIQGASVAFASQQGGDEMAAIRRGIPRQWRRFVPGGAAGGLAQGRTDRDGRITLNRPAQQSTIEVEARGFAPFASEALAFGAEGPSEYTAKLVIGGIAQVAVVDPADKPVVGAMVEHRAPDGETAQKRTDAQGLARFEHLTPGSHQFRLGAPNGGMRGMFAMRMGGQNGGANAQGAPAEEPWTWAPIADQQTTAVKLTKTPTATLRGIVRENGVALAGARVAFREGPAAGEGDAIQDAFGGMAEAFGGGGRGGRGGGGRNQRTDDMGVYQMAELPEGEHRLRVTHGARAMPTMVTIFLRNGENVVDVDLDMTTVRGVVKDSTGKPIEGARIRVRRPRAGDDPAAAIGDAVEGILPGMNMGGGAGGTIRTDAQGAFEVRGVDPDVELELQASAKDFASAAVKVTPARGATTAAPEVVLAGAGKVRVSVTGNNGFGAVRARWLGAEPAPAPALGVLRRGKGTIEGLRPGPWEITLESMESLGGQFGGQFGGRFGGRQGQQGQNQVPVEPTRKRTVEVVAGQTVDVEL
ncbi:MAG: carboxypeptidase regulatory-like domain-containing protein [Planctomycetes bacterium]|nr:carboxypeptidase regulatory-like domain-containing protein [Planctomycetota bacterium]